MLFCVNILRVFIFIVTFSECNEKKIMISKILKSIILGPPGSGKGTISERIIKDFRTQHLSSGDVLRRHVRDKTELGITVKKFIEKGMLVPDDVMIALIGEEIAALAGNSLLLDGFPRTVSQAKSLQQKYPVDVVISLNVPSEVIIDRIKGRLLHPPSGRVYHTEFNPPKLPGKDDLTGDNLIQREDDKEETVRARLESYSAQTKPVLDFYRESGILKEFTGTKSNEIWPHVHKYLASKMTPLQYTEYT